MNTLIIDIRENGLRALLSNDGLPEYCRTFDFEATPLPDTDTRHTEETTIRHTPASDNPYLLYYDTGKTNAWNLVLNQIIKEIRSDVKSSIDSTHLIIPFDEVRIATHQLPKMSHADSLKLIERKVSAESKEEFPPFSIIPASSDQKTQTWFSLYIPSITLKDYRKAFASCQLRLSSITTPVNAMINAFQSVRDAIFNTYAVFEIHRGFVEAYYITVDGILHFERLPYAKTSASPDGGAEEADKSQKLKLFKIINTIFRINSNYQSTNPQIPVQMAWVCGLESGLADIAEALKEAMGIDVATAPTKPTGLPDESGYVPLSGFASALLHGSATSYSAADFFRRFPLRKTSGIFIYAISACAALLTFTLTEREFRNLTKQAKQLQQATDSKTGRSRSSAASAYTKNIEALQKLTSRQIVFYNLFRELATELPDGLYLENLEFQLKDNKGIINITAFSRLDDKLAETMLLSKYMAMFDRSPHLKNHREPNITVIAREKERLLKITVTSEVSPLDTTK